MVFFFKQKIYGTQIDSFYRQKPENEIFHQIQMNFFISPQNGL